MAGRYGANISRFALGGEFEDDHAQIFEQAQAERYRRMIGSFSTMVGRLTEYLGSQKDGARFKAACLENVLAELTTLEKLNVVNDPKFDTLSRQIRTFVNKIDSDAIRDTKQNGTPQAIQAESNKLSGELEKLEKSCQGLI
jgi:leucyl-tRNA synthetase